MSDDPNNTVNAPTSAQIAIIRTVIYTSTIPGTIVCGLVLLAYATVLLYPNARKLLDRVSLRLLVYALISNVVFGIVSSVSMPGGVGPGCRAGEFLYDFSLSLTTCFTTCIAINLQLVLVHGVNSQRMEKFYVIGTIILCLTINLVTLGLSKSGRSGLDNICWFVRAPVALVAVWLTLILLLPAIEFISSAVVLFWLYRFQRRINSLMAASMSPSSLDSFGPQLATANAGASWFTNPSNSPLMRLDEPRYGYSKIILRIALYPIVSFVTIFANLILEFVIGPSKNFRLTLTDIIMFGVRTFVLGSLAASDPSFINAIREIRGSKRKAADHTSHPLSKLDFSPGRETVTGSQVATRDEVGGSEGDVESKKSPLPDGAALAGPEDILQPTEDDWRTTIEQENFRNFARQL